MRQKDWRPDGGDLMDEAELYYKEAKQTKSWGRKGVNGNGDTVYAFRATGEDQMDNIYQETIHYPRKDHQTRALEALSAQIKDWTSSKWGERETSNVKPYSDDKYKWKLKQPKDGESTTKKVLADGKLKKYHWCEYHKLWTIHSPKECKKQPIGKPRVKKATTKGKTSKYGYKKKPYLEARSALDAEYGIDGADSNTSFISNDEEESLVQNIFNNIEYSNEEEDSESS
jgi:hypothetical protein